LPERLSATHSGTGLALILDTGRDINAITEDVVAVDDNVTYIRWAPGRAGVRQTPGCIEDYVLQGSRDFLPAPRRGHVNRQMRREPLSLDHPAKRHCR
jgi:hypothetical protein